MTRENRADAIQTERKRRKGDTLDRMAGMKLAIPPEFANDKDHYYFWANDVGGRVYDLTVNDDYDVVKSSNVESGEDDRVRRPVGQDEGGNPVYAQLLRKPVEFVQADEKARDVARREQERNLSVKAQSDPENQATTYVVKGSQINTGYKP